MYDMDLAENQLKLYEGRLKNIREIWKWRFSRQKWTSQLKEQKI
jgi:hypothetical protein